MTKKRAEINSRIENPESWVDQYEDFLYRFTLSRVKKPSIAEDSEISAPSPDIDNCTPFYVQIL